MFAGLMEYQIKTSHKNNLISFHIIVDLLCEQEWVSTLYACVFDALHDADPLDRFISYTLSFTTSRNRNSEWQIKLKNKKKKKNIIIGHVNRMFFRRSYFFCHFD